MRTASTFLLLLLAACGRNGGPDPAGDPTGTPIRTATSGVSGSFERQAEDPDGLILSVRDGEAGATPYQPNATPSTSPLDDATVARLLGRVDDLPEADRTDFAVRPASKPRPRTGDTVDVPFPPPVVVAPPEVPTGPVSVLRFRPDGDIELAPHVSLTFDRPMVALSTQDDAAAKVPATLVPEPDGQWRWLGTSTLLFEPERGRMPMATRYRLTIPAGTAAPDGSTIDTAFEQVFTTPPPTMTTYQPAGRTVGAEPVIFMAFDQAVDPAAIADIVVVSARSDRAARGVRLATTAEIASDPQVQRAVDGAKPGRWVALVPEQPLPLDTSINVALPVGTPSAEGPLTTTKAQSWSFQTYGPLALRDTRCGWNDRECRPGWPLYLHFSNPLVVTQDTDALVTIAPPVPGAQVILGGDTLTIQGRTEPNTRYTVTVDARLQDVFDQTLGESVTATFDVGPADDLNPWVQLPGTNPLIPDPFGDTNLAVLVQGVSSFDLEVRRVTPDDWAAYHAFLRKQHRDDAPPLPGALVASKRVPVPSPKSIQHLVDVPLAEYLQDGAGDLIVTVEIPASLLRGRYAQRQVVWVDATKLGLDVAVDAQEAVVVVTDLRSGQAVSGAEVEAAGPGGSKALGRTDAKGWLRVPSLDIDSEWNVLVAATDTDTALLTATGGAWGRRRWSPGEGGTNTVWFVFDDRGLYRPSETVHVKGWMRRVDMSEGGDLLAPEDLSGPVQWTLRDATGNELGAGELTMDRFGGVALDVVLPDTPNLGMAQLELKHRWGRTWHRFDIQEFRRPEFEVTTRVETAAPHVLGAPVLVAGTGAYYAGGALPGAPVRWDVNATQASWRPAGWDGFHFGANPPGWWCWGPWRPWTPPAPGVMHAGATDAMGTHRVEIVPERAWPPVPYTVNATATITDVNRQAWSSSTSFLVHSADVYVGAKADKGFVEAGDPVEVALVAVDLDGEAVADVAIDARLIRREQRWKQGEWHTVDAEVLTCETTSKTEPVPCTFTPENAGAWELQVQIEDSAGRPNRTTTTVWVSGEQDLDLPSQVTQEQVLLLADHETYDPGDVAEVLVQAPFSPAYGVVTYRRGGIVHVEGIDLPEGHATIAVPLEAAHFPALHVQVEVVGTAPRSAGDTPRPAFATGRVRLAVPPRARSLTVDVAPEQPALAPGEDTSIDVVVTDATGAPVAGAQVALVMVDESVLALSGHQIPDPLDLFHPDRGSGGHDLHNRGWIQLDQSLATVAPGGAEAKDEDRFDGAVMEMAEGDAPMRRMAKSMSAPAAAPVETEALQALGYMSDAAAVGGNLRDAESGPTAPKIALRTDFRPDALFAPAVLTDQAGKATVPVDLPDNLTRYRIVAVAVDDAQSFGRGEADVTVRLPLMLRPSAPRFLQFGDVAELPLVLQNQTDDRMTVEVALGASNASVDGGARGGRRVRVPPNDRVEVRIPISTIDAGTAIFQAVATSGAASDAARFEFPVWTPATSEAFATYGHLDGPKGLVAMKQALDAPDDVWPQFGQLEISTSTTKLAALTDAVIHLVDYPYGCAEQIASRLLAIAALRDVLAAFDAEGLPPAEKLRKMVDADIDEIVHRQNHDGSWGFWRYGERPSVWASLHVTHALVRAKSQGFEVPKDRLDRALSRLRSIDGMFHDRWWTERAKNVARAQAIMIRRLAGEDTGAEASRLLTKAGGVEELPLEALGWILPSLNDAGDRRMPEILAYLENKVEETAATAQWTSVYTETEAAVLLHSDRRTDAVLLDAMLQVDPEHDVLPKVVEGLLGARVRGRWSSTQDTSWVLLALHRYFTVAEKVTPDLVARAWLGDGYAGDHAFQGRSTDTARITVPMSWVVETGDTDLTLARDGVGRMYYRLGLSYAPKSLTLDPAERGFTVTRRYAAMDDPDDVTRDDDGTWRIKAGARVEVTLEMVAPSRRYHVALVDPLPAGLEPQNPDLEGVADLPPMAARPDDRADWPWWWGVWYDHENLRDERVEAFSRQVWAGVHTYRYVARATTPGHFVVPPAKAEEMYHPETFGRTGTDRVVVVP